MHDHTCMINCKHWQHEWRKLPTCYSFSARDPKGVGPHCVGVVPTCMSLWRQNACMSQKCDGILAFWKPAADDTWVALKLMSIGIHKKYVYLDITCINFYWQFDIWLPPWQFLLPWSLPIFKLAKMRSAMKFNLPFSSEIWICYKFYCSETSRVKLPIKHWMVCKNDSELTLWGLAVICFVIFINANLFNRNW